jgi:hypothetical protein
MKTSNFPEMAKAATAKRSMMTRGDREELSIHYGYLSVTNVNDGQYGQIHWYTARNMVAAGLMQYVTVGGLKYAVLTLAGALLAG